MMTIICSWGSFSLPVRHLHPPSDKASPALSFALYFTALYPLCVIIPLALCDVWNSIVITYTTCGRGPSFDTVFCGDSFSVNVKLTLIPEDGLMIILYLCPLPSSSWLSKGCCHLNPDFISSTTLTFAQCWDMDHPYSSQKNSSTKDSILDRLYVKHKPDNLFWPLVFNVVFW